MEFYLDSTSRSPIFRQIQDQVRYAISVGELRPGDVLPSIRELEHRLGINRNTVRRAYVELQIEGTVHMRAGREAIIAPHAETVRPPRSIDRSVADGTFMAEMLKRVEAAGLDSIEFAKVAVEVAREHDAVYPRCAFLECSDRQATYLATQAESHLRRRVVAVNLRALQVGQWTLPASVRFLITPHWHAAEVAAIAESYQSMIAVSVQITSACADLLRSITDDRIGLVVRDAESLPGFRERLRQHVGRTTIDTALADDKVSMTQMLKRVRHVVYTPPAAESVHALAPPGVDKHELVFEITPADLDSAASRMFPPMPQDAHAQRCSTARQSPAAAIPRT